MNVFDRRWVWLPPLGWMTLIWSMSADSSSGVKSLRIARFLWRWLLGPLTGTRPDYPLLQTTDAIFRKLCHVGEYTVLAIMLYVALSYASRLTDRASIRRWTIWLSVLWAATDELHQGFVPGRGSHLSDVGIDLLGILIALALAAIVIRLCRPSPVQP